MQPLEEVFFSYAKVDFTSADIKNCDFRGKDFQSSSFKFLETAKSIELALLDKGAFESKT